ncbi:hypothetical protein SH139x_004482 [Planctomycetaceae bacterium SH139]
MKPTLVHFPLLDRYKSMRSTRVMAVCVILFTSAMGCGGDSAGKPNDGPDASPATVNFANDLPAPISDGAAGEGGAGEGGSSTRFVSGTDDTPRQVLDAMITTYRSAENYSDRGIVRLSYTRAGREHVDDAPLAVALQRNRALRMHAYGAELAIERGRLRAVVNDPLSNNLDGQMVDVAFDRQNFGLADIYADPLLTHFSTAGLGGPSPQLELLLSDAPLSGLFSEQTQLSFGEPAEIDARPCRCLVVTAEALRYRFWVDQEKLLLRRVELPGESAGLSGDPSVSQVRLTIELREAQFAIAAEVDWNLPRRPNQFAVKALVPPPPPMISPFLGSRLSEFELRSRRPAANRGSAVRVNQRGSDRDYTVLLWIANHPASQQAARVLQSIADSEATSSTSAVRFVIVMAEPDASDPTATQTLLRSWGVGLPGIDDLAAVGRDVFKIAEAPTLVVLGKGGQLEWFQPRVGPELATGLPALLTDLKAGQRVGEAMRQQALSDQATYRKLLEEARSSPPETLPR